MAMPWQIAVVPACVAVWLVAFGPGGKDNGRVAPVLSRAVPSLTADVSATDTLKPTVARSAEVVNSNVVMTAETPTTPRGMAADTRLDANAALAPHEVEAATSHEVETQEVETSAAHDATPAEPIVVAALTDSSETLPAEKPPVDAAIVSAPATESSGPEPAPAAVTAPAAIKSAVGTVEILDECYVMDACVDRYLWALYQRTPKEDAVKEQDQRKVTVKKKGKMVTVTRTITRVVDEDFAWKDPKAAEHVGMPMMDYVIGGVDQSFKLKLFHLLLAAEQAGLSPGITSAFRDDYRQSIASGLKAANDRSYHGGSFRGGYGHGLAADVVSTNGGTRALRQASSEILWKWIDTHGQEFGVGRPYLDHDPPHVAPIDGKEYADHHRGGTKSAGGDARKRNRAAARDGHTAAKRDPAKPKVMTAAR
jgi:hypothetical protein